MINATQTDVIPSIPTPVEEAGLFAILVFMMLIIVLGLVMVLRNNSKAKFVLDEVDAEERKTILGFVRDTKELYKLNGERLEEISKLKSRVALMLREINALKSEIRTCAEIEEQNALLKREIIGLKQQNALLGQENNRLNVGRELNNV